MDRRLISGAVFLTIAVVVAVVFVDKKYSEISAVKNTLQAKENELKGWQEAIYKVEEINKKFALILKDVEKIDELLPEEKNIADLFVQMDYIISRNGLVAKTVSFSPVSETQVKNGKYSVIRIKLELAGSYEAFMSFIGDIEKNIHLMDASAFSISNSQDTEEKQGFGFQVSIDAYYK